MCYVSTTSTQFYYYEAMCTVVMKQLALCIYIETGNTPFIGLSDDSNHTVEEKIKYVMKTDGAKT